MTLVEWIYSGKCLQNYKKKVPDAKGVQGDILEYGYRKNILLLKK